MHKALSLLLLFFIGSSVGWVLEFFFRRYFAPEKKWVNPGFLTGPCLPIYGFGTCTLYLLASAEVFLPVENITLRRVILFVAMAVCMTVIEYIAGLSSLWVLRPNYGITAMKNSTYRALSA